MHRVETTVLDLYAEEAGHELRHTADLAHDEITLPTTRGLLVAHPVAELQRIQHNAQDVRDRAAVDLALVCLVADRHGESPSGPGYADALAKFIAAQAAYAAAFDAWYTAYRASREQVPA